VNTLGGNTLELGRVYTLGLALLPSVTIPSVTVYGPTRRRSIRGQWIDAPCGAPSMHRVSFVPRGTVPEALKGLEPFPLFLSSTPLLPWIAGLWIAGTLGLGWPGFGIAGTLRKYVFLRIAKSGPAPVLLPAR